MINFLSFDPYNEKCVEQIEAPSYRYSDEHPYLFLGMTLSLFESISFGLSGRFSMIQTENITPLYQLSRNHAVMIFNYNSL